MAVIVEMMKPDCCLDCRLRTCLLGEIICPVAGIINDVHSLLPKCPIIGEISNEHGRIVDISRVENFLTKWENRELDYEPDLDEVLSMIRYSIKTILEASNGIDN